MKIKRRLSIKILKHLGCSDYASKCYADLWLEDIASENKIPLNKKIWAYRRGFLSYNSRNYGLTEANYKYYLSDLDYARMFPINNTYKKWIDDKITIKMVLSTYNSFLPEYYYSITKEGRIIPLVDIDKTVNISTIESIIKVLKVKEKLAAKQTSGTSGNGFYRLSYDGLDYFINNDKVNYEELVEFLRNLKDYIITEYVITHSEISKYNNKPNNTIRVMTVNENGFDPVITNALLKISIHQSSEVDFDMEGGICAIIDVNTGYIKRAKKSIYQTGSKINEAIDIDKHPISGIEIKGYIPHWEEVKDKLIEMSGYLSEIQYMGYDVMITEDSFKILEINSHQDIDHFQDFYPLLENNLASSFFNKLVKQIRH